MGLEWTTAARAAFLMQASALPCHDVPTWQCIRKAASRVSHCSLTVIHVQATALLTPVLESLAGGRLSRVQWLSCAVALTGSLVITTAHVSPAVPAAAAAAPAAAFAVQSSWLTTLGALSRLLACELQLSTLLHAYGDQRTSPSTTGAQR